MNERGGEGIVNLTKLLSGRCDGSNHQGKPNASSQPSGPFPRMFDHDGIPFELRTIDRK